MQKPGVAGSEKSLLHFAKFVISASAETEGAMSKELT